MSRENIGFDSLEKCIKSVVYERVVNVNKQFEAVAKKPWYGDGMRTLFINSSKE